MKNVLVVGAHSVAVSAPRCRSAAAGTIERNAALLAGSCGHVKKNSRPPTLGFVWLMSGGKDE